VNPAESCSACGVAVTPATSFVSETGVVCASFTAGTLVFSGVSISQIRDARLFLLLFPVVFGWWLGLLTWRARDVFVPPSRLEIRE
jgi:hypothetical protein